MSPTDRRTDELPPLSETPPDIVDGVLVDLRCSVALIRNDQLLLLHRTAHPGRQSTGDWVLPGGHPRDGESMRACATRETLEETGLSVDAGRCLFVYEVVGPTETGRRVELVFAATTSNLDALGQRETDRHPELVNLEDLPGVDLRPPLAGYLRGLRWPQPPGAAYLGNLWRPPRAS
ncbi:MAG: NUDIX hydrolase [Propionibacteriaceae bacterium]|nr:NUDIX hydrolase [Propionibacteriaceae bacterium]